MSGKSNKFKIEAMLVNSNILIFKLDTYLFDLLDKVDIHQ